MNVQVRARGIAGWVLVLLPAVAGACGRSAKQVNDGAMSASGAGGEGGGTGGSAAGTGGTATAGASGAGSADCDGIANAYEAALEDALRCDSENPNPCAKRIDYGLQCGCEIYVNADATDAMREMMELASAYSSGSCGGDVVCGECGNVLGANCIDDVCQTVEDNGGRGCKLDGVIYSHGATNIPSPDGCNECTCEDGDLKCTEIGCPNPNGCADGTTFGTQCALCAPDDDCLLVEYRCLETCGSNDDCSLPNSECLSGACITGLCG